MSRTLPVPLVHRVPRPLSAVLHVLDLRETSAGDAEELDFPNFSIAIASSVEGFRVSRRHLRQAVEWSAVILRQRRDMRAAYHDPIGDEGLERDAHDRGGLFGVF